MVSLAIILASTSLSLYLIFLKGMEFLEEGKLAHSYISFACAFLNFLAGMRFAIANMYKKIKSILKK